MIFQSKIDKLPRERGGYHYLYLSADDLESLKMPDVKRFICEADNHLEFHCGLCHTGDGNFFIILSKDKMKVLQKSVGETVSFTLREDPNPLGAEMPEAMQILLDQDPVLQAKFDSITDGKKRGIIHYIASTKNIDLQVERTIMMLEKYGR